MEFFTFINLGGTIAFAASGALAGIRKKLDIFGVMVIAFVTSIGGGTIRDLLIGNLPVKWILDSYVILLMISVTILTVLFRKHIEKVDKTLVLFDTLGLGFFTLRGIEEGLNAHLSMVSCIILGTITACFGGVIRDILLNEIPTLFRKEIYATACLLGGFLYFFLHYLSFSEGFISLTTFVFIIAVRFLAIKRNISLPKIEI